MRRGAILILLTGCSLIWDPDGYVREDGSVDAGPTDADLEDADGDDATLDAPLDVPVDVSEDAGPCDLTMYETPGEVVTSNLSRALVTYPGPGPALIINQDGIRIEDVDIRLGDNATAGIQIEPGVSNIVINRVRVVLDRSRDNIERYGLVAAGTTGVEIRNLQVTDFELEGMLGIDATAVEGSTFERVHVREPMGGEASPLVAIQLTECSDVRFQDLMVGPDETRLSLTSAIVVQDSAQMTFLNGVIESTCTSYAFDVQGGTASDPANSIENFAVTGSVRGFRFSRAMNWDVAAKVVRPDCINGDYAFDDTGSEAVDCIDCWEFGCAAATEPPESLLDVGGAEDGSYNDVAPVNLCFSRVF